jgi:hypothetical protein
MYKKGPKELFTVECSCWEPVGIFPFPKPPYFL